MFWSWKEEHEADIYSSKKVDPYSLVSAIIKIYLYSCLEDEEVPLYNTITNFDLDLSQTSKIIRRYDYKQILFLFIKLSIEKYIKNNKCV